jgi:hypothetical protein
MRCPLCTTDISDDAQVCAGCGRDIAVPDTLIAERIELLAKRDVLKAELDAASERLATRRKRKSGAGPV